MGSTIHYQPPVFSPQPHIGYAKETGTLPIHGFPCGIDRTRRTLGSYGTFVQDVQWMKMFKKFV